MASTIQRLETKTGVVYSMGTHWPGTVDSSTGQPFPAPDGKEVAVHDQLKVGPIFFVPGEEEPVYDEDESEIIGSEKIPPFFELWCVTDRKLGVFLAHLRGQDVPKEELEVVANSGQITRRVIYLEAISSYDEDMSVPSAFRKMTERFVEMYGEEEKSSGEQQQQQQAAQQPGNGIPQQAGG